MTLYSLRTLPEHGRKRNGPDGVGSTCLSLDINASIERNMRHAR